MLCWWHTALSFISTRWSNFRLPGGHLGMDERTSLTAKPGKDWASCLPCHSNSTAWLHDSARFINNYPINFGQKSWCNLWWPADLQRAHCKDCSILQVCTSQHQKDQALSDRACRTTSWPGPCNFYAGLLQCSSVWNSSKHNQCFYKLFRMQRHDWSSTSPKEPMLHLSLSPCTGYQLQLASSSRHWCLHIEQPQAQHPPTSTHYYKSTSPPEVWDLLVSTPRGTSQRGSKSLSRTFSFTVPGRWNDLPTPIRNDGSLSIFKQQLKTHLFRHYLTSS